MVKDELTPANVIVRALTFPIEWAVLYV